MHNPLVTIAVGLAFCWSALAVLTLVYDLTVIAFIKVNRWFGRDYTWNA